MAILIASVLLSSSQFFLVLLYSSQKWQFWCLANVCIILLICRNLKLHKPLDEFKGDSKGTSCVNTARSPNAAQSKCHPLLRCQVVLTKRLFCHK